MTSDNWAIHKYHVLTRPDEYSFEIHEFRRGSDKCLFAHLGFDKFSPSILRKFEADWDLFRQHVPGPVFCYPSVGDLDKFERFISRLGFRPTGQTITCENGECRPLFINSG